MSKYDTVDKNNKRKKIKNIKIKNNINVTDKPNISTEKRVNTNTDSTIKNNEEYILCFKDFRQPEQERKPCVFVRLTNKTNDTKTDIMSKFLNISPATSFLKLVGIVEDGAWGLIACERIDSVFRCNYDA